MSLSIQKLQNLLESKGFIPMKYFTLDGFCFYIEVWSTKSAEIFLLYIPSKYEFENRSTKDSFKMKQINMKENNEDISETITKKNHVEDIYTGKIQLSPHKEKMRNHLEDGYKQEISLSDIPEEDIVGIKAVYRQLFRLKYCVQNLKYKIGIIYKNYMCVIRRDDSINCFVLKGYPKENKKFYIIIDLETFYDKNDKILEDIHTVQSSVFKILERNQVSHSVVLSKMIDNKKEMENIPEKVYIKKANYENMLKRLENQLAVMLESEEKVNTELKNLLSNTSTNLQNDITRAHERTKLEKELEKIIGIKGRITSTISFLRDKLSTTILAIDDIMFNNAIMFDEIIKNFATLKEYC